jgi:ribose 1,5-bisphosphokinase PhnN
MSDGQGLVLVVGSSGVGKDAVIGASRTRLANEPRVHFVRRVLTWAAVPGAEDHDSCDAATFRSRADSGAFALHWTANGLHYGLPVTLEQALGGMVANVSRGVLPRAANATRGSWSAASTHRRTCCAGACVTAAGRPTPRSRSASHAQGSILRSAMT